MTIPETLAAPAVRILANGQSGDCRIEVGENAVAGLMGLICGATSPSLRDEMKLHSEGRVMSVGSEGVTAPSLFKAIMADQD